MEIQEAQVHGPRSQVPGRYNQSGVGASPSWKLPASSHLLAAGSSSERPAAAGFVLGFSTESERLQVWRAFLFFLSRLHLSGAAGSRRDVSSQREQTGRRHSSKHSDSSERWRTAAESEERFGGGGRTFEPPRRATGVQTTHTSGWRPHPHRPSGESTNKEGSRKNKGGG